MSESNHCTEIERALRHTAREELSKRVAAALEPLKELIRTSRTIKTKLILPANFYSGIPPTQPLATADQAINLLHSAIVDELAQAAERSTIQNFLSTYALQEKHIEALELEVERLREQIPEQAE